MPATRPGCHLYLCFWPTGYWLEGPMTPSLGLINLLEQLTQLRDTFCSVDYKIIVNRYNSGIARWKRWMQEGDTIFHAISRHSWSQIWLLYPKTKLNLKGRGFFFSFQILFIWLHKVSVAACGVSFLNLITNAVIASGEQWRDSAIHSHVPILPPTPPPIQAAT